MPNHDQLLAIYYYPHLYHIQHEQVIHFDQQLPSPSRHPSPALQDIARYLHQRHAVLPLLNKNEYQAHEG